MIYRDATSLDLVDAGYAWIVTEQALLPHNTPIGCILCLLDCHAYVYDTIQQYTLASSYLSCSCIRYYSTIHLTLAYW